MTNDPAPPFFSVIIVCRNPGVRLQAALASVWAQHGENYQLVVIDGGSTDGTREWLETRRDQIAALRSEPDRGVYEAMNKGIALARGKWLLFLGADDRLVDAEVLGRVQLPLEKTAADVASGETSYDDGRIYRLGDRINPIARNFSHHQATFYRAALFPTHGGFDPSLKIMGDYDVNLRLWKRGIRFEPLPLRIADCGSGGLSDAGRWRGYAEEIRVRHRHFPSWRCWWWDALSIARFLRKKIVRSFIRHG